VLELVANNQIEEAWRQLKTTNPMPSITGRVCGHNCEKNCNRALVDQAINIHSLERFVGDYGQKHSLMPKKAAPPSDRQIAIIGAGPAGLSCAYYLALAGIKATVFDSHSRPGGMLVLGIPAYRLPPGIVENEIEMLKKLGVTFEMNTLVTQKIFQNLHDKFDGVYIAPGAHQSGGLKIEGWNLEEVKDGLQFLKQINQGEQVEIGQKVLVIGGGNTAMDTARAARRQGAEALVAYRRTRLEMPALAEEIDFALEEGVTIEFLCAPVKISKQQGKLAVDLIRMELGPEDESGRRRPMPIEGSNFTISGIDRVLSAIGEWPDLSFFESQHVDNRSGQINVDSQFRTPIKGIYAGGDAATGLGTVSDALASGRRGANAILIDLDLKNSVIQEICLDDVAQINTICQDHFTPSERMKPAQKIVSDRLANFSEVIADPTADLSIQEAARCLNCGTCVNCDVCWSYCPDMSIKKENNSLKIDYQFCKGCGICVTECPRMAMKMVMEDEVIDE